MKPRIVDDATLRALAERFGTPLFVYDAATITARAAELLEARDAGRGFDVVRYAQKANPNLSLARLLLQRGCALDAVSSGELRRALALACDPRDVSYCADLFDDDALQLVTRHPFQLVAGSPDMLERYAAAAPPRRDIALRINPGFGHGHDAKVATGGEQSKHGIWHAELARVVDRARELGLRVTGLHVHIGSGSDLEHLARASAAVVEAAEVVRDSLEMLSCGGGLPIPYRDSEARFDVPRFLAHWNRARMRIEERVGRALRLEVEPGRFLVAEAGLLLARVLGTKRSAKSAFVFLDAGFHNLLRPALYGAYHELSLVGRDAEPREPQVVAGPLCESADVFTQEKHGRIVARELPRARAGDLCCIHDTGAYAAAMASGYNSQLLAAEVMLHNGRARLVRARQTIDQLLRPELECLE